MYHKWRHGCDAVLVELRFHGRGGQGAVTAANILAAAAVIEGKYAQAFPYFGAERRGAPVEAYARISDRPIERHSQVKTPDIVVVLDPSIFEIADVTRGLKPGGLIVVNSDNPPVKGEWRVWCVNATRIAMDLGLVVSGWPVVNTSMLGALSKASRVVGMDAVDKSIRSYFQGKLGELNAEAARRAYSEASLCWDPSS
jgi:pyruvate ferredoxin oxidoreductase gamma subunit